MLLAEETLKIVISVIAISFLIYFLFSLYSVNLIEKKQKQSENILNSLEENIASLKEGESFSQDIPNPVGWYVFNFTGSLKPNVCSGISCLCICANKWPMPFVSELERQAKECTEDGRCLAINNLQPFEEFEILSPEESLNKIKVKKQEEDIFIEKEK